MQDYTKDDVAKHNSPDDAWTIFEGKVYDVTKYASYHPGGTDTIMMVAGKDSTALVCNEHALLLPPVCGSLASELVFIPTWK